MRTITQIACLFAVSLGMFRQDVETMFAFIAVMSLCIWGMPELVCWIMKEEKK